MSDDDEILASISASPGRRILGVGCLWTLAAIVLTVGVTQPPAPGWQLFLLLTGLAALYAGNVMRVSTSHRIELTKTEMRDSSGIRIARVADIVAVDRGVFAFKPSNGFLLKLAQRDSRQWQPGLWWRTGNRVGVGGMTPGHQAKFMAEILSAMIAQR